MAPGQHSIAEIIRNDEKRYEGNLIPYFKVLLYEATNLRHPYHNLRHMLHVMWLCYDAAVYYGSRLNPREIRNLLIAALFHDFDHAGQVGNDDLNIERALRGLRTYRQKCDVRTLVDIEEIIKDTEYPHRTDSSTLTLRSQILRDADVSQALNGVWLQQVVIGLATEWGKSPLEILRMQGEFHRNLQFSTQWAREKFPPPLVEAKIKEAEELLAILEAPLEV